MLQWRYGSANEFGCWGDYTSFNRSRNRSKKTKKENRRFNKQCVQCALKTGSPLKASLFYDLSADAIFGVLAGGVVFYIFYNLGGNVAASDTLNAEARGGIYL